MTTNTNGNTNQITELLFNEAPASWNTRYISPEGFECQQTLSAETAQELLERDSGAISQRTISSRTSAKLQSSMVF